MQFTMTLNTSFQHTLEVFLYLRLLLVVWSVEYSLDLFVLLDLQEVNSSMNFLCGFYSVLSFIHVMCPMVFVIRDVISTVI
jgi:hypothetical protein